MRAFCPPKNTPEKDIVMTPEWLAKEIIEHFKPSGVILDPCRGEGVFYSNFPVRPCVPVLNVSQRR